MVRTCSNILGALRLIDRKGFPRKMDTAEYFEKLVKPFACVLVLECPVEVLQQRLLQRRRVDDNAETIRKRVETFNVTTAVVLEKYATAGKIGRVNADAEVAVVAADIQRALEGHNVDLQAKSSHRS
jgi:UMP-CMP kinase